MRLRLKQILKNNTILWKFVSISAPPFNYHYTSYYSSSSVIKRLIHLTRRLFDSEQLAVLMRNGRLRSMHPNDTPMAMLRDVKRVLPQLKTFFDIGWQGEQIQQYQSADGPSKRQRTG